MTRLLRTFQDHHFWSQVSPSDTDQLWSGIERGCRLLPTAANSERFCLSLPGLRLINHSLTVSCIKTVDGELDRVEYTFTAAKERERLVSVSVGPAWSTWRVQGSQGSRVRQTVDELQVTDYFLGLFFAHP